MQEVTSNIAVTEKNEKQYVTDYIYKSSQGPKGGAFWDKGTPDIDGFTAELMWCSSCKKILL